MPTPLARRLQQALSAMNPRPSQADLARAADVKGPSVHAWLHGPTKSLGKALLPISRLLDVNPEWLNTGRGPMRPAGNATHPRYRVTEAPHDYDAASEIRMLDARGSCGGGSVVWELEDREPLIKEPSWFRRYRVKPDDLFAVFADGDSMADFIVDGDIVIFDKSKTEPKTGAIFLIDHPDGLRIKRLRRDIDGSWVLESLNPNKAMYPDERLTSDRGDLLKVMGQFVYRQGG